MAASWPPAILPPTRRGASTSSSSTATTTSTPTRWPAGRRLDADAEASFAYGILEVFNLAGPTDLNSWLDWDPERLRWGNSVDAMAISDARRSWTPEAIWIRASTGWEDFALWRAFADRGKEGVRVPEILAAYRSSIGSMIALTDIDASAAWSAMLSSPGPARLTGYSRSRAFSRLSGAVIRQLGDAFMSRTIWRWISTSAASSWN